MLAIVSVKGKSTEKRALKELNECGNKLAGRYLYHVVEYFLKIPFKEVKHLGYIIVGNSAAGITAATALRRLEPKARIAVVDPDPYGAYTRCMIPDVLAGKTGLNGILFRNADFYRDLNIELIRDRAVAVQPEKHTIALAGGSELDYRRLLLASGARPVKLQMEGIDLQGVFSLRTFADAAGMASVAEQSHRAVVLGGGLVGIKGAMALREKGLPRVTVVMKSSRLLHRQLPTGASELLERELTLAGVTVIRGLSPKSIGGLDDHVQTVVLENGRELLADMVLAAKGVYPNAELLRKAGGLADRGILVNDYLQTSLTDVYAAGDCIEVTDAVTGRRSPAGLWPLAVEQGRYAAYNMAGRRLKYPPPVTAMNAVQFGELALVSVGPVDYPGDEVLTFGPRDRLYRRLVFRDGRLVSAVFTGDVDRSGLYTWLIRSGRRVTDALRGKMTAGTLTAADLAFSMPKEVTS